MRLAVQSPSRDRYHDIARRAAAYWTQNSTSHLGYDQEITVVNDTAGADVLVEFSPNITRCERTGPRRAFGYVYCAPVINSTHEPTRPETVELHSGLTNESAESALIRALGDALGVPEDSSAPVLHGSLDATLRDAPDARNRTIPWPSDNLTVHVAYNGSDAPTTEVETQIRHAIGYYNQGADGFTPTNATLSLTDSRARADVVVTFPDERPCGSGNGSCGQAYGTNYDRDDRLEYYTSYRIAVSGVESDAVGWHVGLWLGAALGATSESELPDPFQSSDYEYRRSAWWEEQ